MTSIAFVRPSVSSSSLFAVGALVLRVIADPRVQAEWHSAGTECLGAFRYVSRAVAATSKACSVTTESLQRNREAR